MENIMNIDEAIEKATKEAARETVKEVIQELKNSRFIKNDISYFRRVELLLINYESLKNAIKQKEEDIEYIMKYGLPERSGSIIMYQGTGGGHISGQERYMQLIEKYNIEKIETEREIRRIENALEKIKNDKYYDIIQFKYLVKESDRMTDEALAEKLDKDQSTITRNKRRLINTIKTILFPESIREFA